MRSFFKTIIFACLLFLSSCYVSMPEKEQTKNIIPPPTLSDTIDTSLESSYFTLGDWPEENWWDLFASADLSYLMGEALAQNPSIQEVEAKIQQAGQEAVIAKSRLFPYLFFDADVTKTYLSKNGLYRAFNPQIPLNDNLIDLSLSLQYEFDFWGKNYNIFMAAYGKRLANEAEAAQVRLIITTSIAQAYFSLKANLIRKHLYEILLHTNEKVYELQSLLEKKALSSRLDPILVQESLFDTKNLLTALEDEIIVGKHLINYLIGKGPDNPLHVDDTLLPLQEPLAIPQNLPADLLARRPDLMAQIWRVKALAYEVGAAQADFYPNVNLAALAGLESVSYSSLFLSASKTYEALPAIHLPIFTAGAIQANVDVRKALFNEAVFSYNDLMLASSQEVADWLALAKSVYKQKAEHDRIVENAKTRFELTTLRQKSGLDSRFNEYEMLIQLVNRELENLTLLYGQYLATIKLIKALGGGYLSPSSIPLEGINDF